MVTIYSNKNSSKNALSASQHIINVVYESRLSFEDSQKEMKKAVERDLHCVKKIKW
jgi:archaellum component FlaD/FlaE